ncbi:MAG TPA: BlaI/MecI/CopY family transcriptional regulator [Chthonomonadaceae bacterium]|nr:BlaI/MecI/CopY family transcriptional regulator [Chthonomonadaceae bacterium]
MNRKRFFSPAEWEILQYVTSNHPLTAREIADHFAATHGWARTTVLTMIERLRDKGYLTRDESGSIHRYAPSAPKSDLMQGLVRDFVQTALGGSVSPFVAYLGKEANLSAEEVQALKQLVRELDVPEKKQEEKDDA